MSCQIYHLQGDMRSGKTYRMMEILLEKMQENPRMTYAIYFRNRTFLDQCLLPALMSVLGVPYLTRRRYGATPLCRSYDIKLPGSSNNWLYQKLDCVSLDRQPKSLQHYDTVFIDDEAWDLGEIQEITRFTGCSELYWAHNLRIGEVIFDRTVSENPHIPKDYQATMRPDKVDATQD